MRYIIWVIGLVVVILVANWAYQLWRNPSTTNNQPATQTIQVYFNESRPTEVVQVAVNREVTASSSEVELADAAIRQLLGGPTADEEARGLSTAIQDGSKLNYVKTDGTTAIVDFNEAFDFQVGGATLVMAIRSQIEKTVLQFPSFTSVRITINNGEREAVLEP